MTVTDKIYFSGHESFICKHFWLKKVFDFAIGHHSFNDEKAVVQLGVGKNMVASLRYWGRAFSILDEQDKTTEFANYLFGKSGRDTYLEDYATIWLLHYHLVLSNRFSIANLIFNEFRKERTEFTKDQLFNFLVRKSRELETNTDNVNTIEREINVFLRQYSKPEKDDAVEIEDDFSGILIDLDLLKRYKQRGVDGKIIDWYKIESQERPDIPSQIILFTILHTHHNQSSITFRELLTGRNSPGCVFALNSEGLHFHLKQIANLYKGIVFSETAGNQVLQLKTKITKYDILDDYYS